MTRDEKQQLVYKYGKEVKTHSGRPIDVGDGQRVDETENLHLEVSVEKRIRDEFIKGGILRFSCPVSQKDFSGVPDG